MNVPLLKITAACLTCLAAAGSAMAQTPGEEEIARLIAQLGDVENYEQAVKQLSELGEAAKPRLRSAVEGDNALVSRRARLVLANIQRRERTQYRRALANGEIDGAALAGWKQFCDVVGDSPEARQLFVAMHRTEPDLMQAFHRNFNKAKEMLTIELLNRETNLWLANQDTLPIGHVAAVAFIVGDKRFQLTADAMQAACGVVQGKRSVLGAIINSQPIRAVDKSEDQNTRKLIGKLIARWLLRPVPGFMDLWKFSILLEYEMPEGLTLAARILGAKNNSDEGLAKLQQYIAILTVGQLGSKEHVALLEPLLSSNEKLVEFFGRRLGKKGTLLCDIALATLVEITDQKIDDYHFAKSSEYAEDGPYLNRIREVSFNSEADRAKGIRKWQAWSKANPVEKRPATDGAG